MPSDLGLPLPDNFYDAEGWQGSLISFYSETNKKYDPEILAAPIKLITSSIANAIRVCGEGSGIIMRALELVINPLFEIGEYKQRVYKAVKDGAREINDPDLDSYAESLLCLHNLFSRDKEFITKTFQKELAAADGGDPTATFIKFAETMKLITKVHVQQVINMVKEVQGGA